MLIVSFGTLTWNLSACHTSCLDVLSPHSDLLRVGAGTGTTEAALALACSVATLASAATTRACGSGLRVRG